MVSYRGFKRSSIFFFSFFLEAFIFICMTQMFHRSSSLLPVFIRSFVEILKIRVQTLNKHDKRVILKEEFGRSFVLCI